MARNRNLFSKYGQVSTSLGATIGKTFVISTSADVANWLIPDETAQLVVYSNWADAVAATVAGRGDVIMVDPAFVTAPTAGQLLTLETNGVLVQPMPAPVIGDMTARRATAALPASTTASIFTVTGRVKLKALIGEVTTVIQTQACNLKAVATPTVGSVVDLCADLNVSALAVGTQLNITGTFADAMVATNGAAEFQAASILLKAGTIRLTTSATNTGSVKWLAQYEPIDPGAIIVAA